MNTLGIDLSPTGTGLAILTDDPGFILPRLPAGYLHVSRPNADLMPAEWYFGWLLSPMPKGTEDRWNLITTAVLACAKSCHQVVMENYAFGASFRVAQLAELGGVVRYELAKQASHHPVMVSPSTLKKFLTGAGNSDKNQVLKEVYKRYGVDLPDDNMADAFGLAKFGQALVSSTDGLPQFQVDVIQNFKKPKEKPSKRRVKADVCV